MSDLPWAAMLKLAGVKVAEIADRAGLSPSYVSKQLSGKMPMQYPVERACRQAIGERREEWYPAAAALIKLLHDWTVKTEVRQILREEGRPGRRPLYD